MGPTLVIAFCFFNCGLSIGDKTVLGNLFLLLKSVMWFPIITGMLFYHVCIAIPLFKFRSDLENNPLYLSHPTAILIMKTAESEEFMSNLISVEDDEDEVENES